MAFIRATRSLSRTITTGSRTQTCSGTTTGFRSHNRDDMKRPFTSFRGMCLRSLARFAFAVSFFVALVEMSRWLYRSEISHNVLPPGTSRTILLFVYERMETFAAPLVWLAVGLIGEVLLRALSSRVTPALIAATAGLWLFPGVFLLALALQELGRRFDNWALPCACIALAAFLWDLGGLAFNWRPSTYFFESRLAASSARNGRAFQVVR